MSSGTFKTGIVSATSRHRFRGARTGFRGQHARVATTRSRAECAMLQLLWNKLAPDQTLPTSQASASQRPTSGMELCAKQAGQIQKKTARGAERDRPPPRRRYARALFISSQSQSSPLTLMLDLRSPLRKTSNQPCHKIKVCCILQ